MTKSKANLLIKIVILIAIIAGIIKAQKIRLINIRHIKLTRKRRIHKWNGRGVVVKEVMMRLKTLMKLAKASINKKPLPVKPLLPHLIILQTLLPTSSRPNLSQNHPTTRPPFQSTPP